MGNKLRDTIYMTAASILHSCLWYEEVELYVDQIGYYYLESLPCKVTMVDFDSNSELWMKPKLSTIEKQDQPFIHIDNDVFLKKSISIEFDEVLVERKDLAYHNYKDLVTFFDPYCNDMAFWDSNLKHVWSCGVIGFKDLELRDDFVNSFKVLEDIFEKNKSNYELFKSTCNGKGWYLEPGLLLEQYNLTSLLSKREVTPIVLIPGESHQQQSSYANDIGYTHLFGASKYHPKNVNKIEELLKQKFYVHYKTINEKIASNEMAMA